MKKKLFAILLCLVMILSSVSILSEVSFAEEEKTFTVTKRAVGSTEDGELVGEYDTLMAAIEACKQEDLSNEYIVTMNKDYEVPENEGVNDRSNVNILFKSAQGSTYTLKRLGTRLIFYVSKNCNMRVENVILDGNNDGELTHVSENGELTLGNGTVVQNFIDVPSVDGPAIYLTGSSTLNIEDGAIIQNNKGDYIGGVIGDNSNNVTINVNGGTFTNNSCTNWGGVIGSYGKVTINGGAFTGNKGNQGAVVYSNGTLTINGGTFEGNQASYSGGVVAVGSKATLNVNGGTFMSNSAKFGSAIYTSKTKNVAINKNKLKNLIFKENASAFGTIYFNGGSANVENASFNNNLAFSRGSAIYNRDANVTVNKTTFKDNGEMTDEDGTYTCIHGGAIAVEKLNSDETKLTVKESIFEGNKAEKDGGAIHTSDSNYVNTVDTSTDYQILSVDKETIFKNNKASGYFDPPENIADLTNINAKETSFTGTKKINPDSPLNNYDINYKRDIVVTYDPNDGNEAVEDKQKEKEVKGYEIKSVKDLKFTNTSKFLEWNTKADGTGTSYQVGDKVDLTGNLYLYAILEKPAPKPSEPSTVILTLDENYRNGKITNIEVEEGDLIEPHLYIPRRRGYIFRGWSYDRKHLDEVKPGDRIYTDTTLYAIWKRAEVEKEEEPIEIKGEDHKTYIFGYPDGSVRPNGSITRAEAAAMLARLLNIEAIGSAAKPQFTDTESSWYNKAINAVVFRGIMKGYPDGRFRPNAPITRAEFTQMISTIDNKPYGVAPFADVPGHWAERAIGSEYQAKRITGYPDGLFRPDANITRAEAAVILNKIFERKYDNLSLLKCKNPQMIKRFTDLDETFWGWNDMVEATNTHEYVRRYKEDVLKRLEEDWLLIK